jgi:putative DNA primase/helicase
MAFEKKQKANVEADYLARVLLDSNFVFDSGAEKLGDAVQEAAFTLAYWRGEFYAWYEGVWKRVSDEDFRPIITACLQQWNDIPAEDAQVQITSQKIRDILLCLSGRAHFKATRTLNSWENGQEEKIYTVALRNGLLQFNRDGTGEPVLLPHTPKYFNVVRLDYDYDPEAQCPLWLSFLDDVMLGRKEYIDLLQQWCGYLFRPDLREQKFLLCVGEGANGKGVFTEVLSAVVGKENCSEISLSRFNNSFALWPMLGKILNATNESSHIIEDEAENVLKSLVAGDRFSFERKFKEPIFAEPTAKIMISTNALPRFNDKTLGLWRRILLVPFDKTIPEGQQVKTLAEELKRELSGVFNWALEGLKRLNHNFGFAVPADSERLIEEYRRDADPCRAFLQERYSVSGNGEYIPCSEAYQAYKQFCSENSYSPLGERNFGQNVRRVFPTVNRARLGSGADRAYVYKGLTPYEGQTTENENGDSD